MKATQFITTQTSALRKVSVSPTGGEMGGVPVLTIDEGRQTGEFLGFGVALTGSSCHELNAMPESQRRNFLQHIYGKDGLNLTVGRLTIAASDYSADLYSYDDVPGDEALAHFSIERDEAYILPMIREALQINPDLYLYAAPWSPPGWMKTGGSMCGGYMREKYIPCYARYIARFLEEYRQRGVSIQAVTPQNEPETDQAGKMPACYWHPDMEAAFVHELSDRLAETDLPTKLWLFDHNFSGWRRVLWTISEHPALQEKLSGVAFHYYAGAIEDVAAVQEAFPQLGMHFTEGGPRLLDNYATDHCKWGTMLVKVLRQGFRSFCGWNLMLDETGGPNIGPFFCGGLVTRNSETGELTYSGQYNALRHFAPFIQRRARCMASSLSNNNRTLFGNEVFIPTEACAVLNPDGSEVIFAVNASKGKRQIQLFRHDRWWYFELLPDSLSTIVFEEGVQ